MEGVRSNQTGGLGIECLVVSESMVRNLRMRVEGMERAQNVNDAIYCVKCCPTRHGCSGATNCDCSLSDYKYGH